MPAGREALALGANGIEVDEPRLEQRLRDGFEGGVGFAQEGDAVVERTEQFRDLDLYCQWRESTLNLKQSPTRMWLTTEPDRFMAAELVLQRRRIEQEYRRNRGAMTRGLARYCMTTLPEEQPIWFEDQSQPHRSAPRA